jgi:hypothetical protein
MMNVYELLESTRYYNERTSVPKDDWLSKILFRYSNNDFKQIARMDKSSFNRIVDLIKNDHVFHGNSKHKQAPVWLQLLVVMQRLGCDGNGASVGRTVKFNGISDGTVVLYIKRVFKAILHIKNEFIRWSNAIEREEISQRFAENDGLPGCIGIVDGTPIHFAQKPAVDPEVFFTRKSRYSINVQLIYDDTKRIIEFVTGWPGPVHDTRCFEDSAVYKHPELHFPPSSSWLVAPYIQPAASIPENEVFNQLFSTARVTIEHVNGILKYRFSSLRGIRIQIKTENDFADVNKWIIVCLIIHNMLISFNDDWIIDDDSDDNSDDDLDDDIIVHEPFNQNIAPERHALREIVKESLLNWFYARQNNNG